MIIITPTSTPNSRLYSRTYLVLVLAKCHRSATPLWFHLVFESQRRRHACLVSIGAGRRRRDSPAPAPGLDHDYGQITTSVVLLGVQVADVRRGYLGGRRRRQVPAPVPAPGLHPDYGQIATSVVLLGVQVTDVRRGYLGGRRRQVPAPAHRRQRRN